MEGSDFDGGDAFGGVDFGGDLGNGDFSGGGPIQPSVPVPPPLPPEVDPPDTEFEYRLNDFLEWLPLETAKAIVDAARCSTEGGLKVGVTYDLERDMPMICVGAAAP